MRKLLDVLRLAEAAAARENGINMDDIKQLLRLSHENSFVSEASNETRSQFPYLGAASQSRETKARYVCAAGT
jgi:DNA-binding transcriptional MerR regulator